MIQCEELKQSNKCIPQGTVLTELHTQSYLSSELSLQCRCYFGIEDSITQVFDVAILDCNLTGRASVKRWGGDGGLEVMHPNQQIFPRPNPPQLLDPRQWPITKMQLCAQNMFALQAILYSTLFNHFYIAYQKAVAKQNVRVFPYLSHLTSYLLIK